MKKFLFFVVSIALSINLSAQCPLTTAVDFTATDCHGTEVNLFSILDGGQYVLIDFFYTTCGPCQQATPKVVESYSMLGCNMHEVFYMEITPYDGDAACQQWCNNYGVEYPTIGTSGGGSTICNTYQIGAYPTLILIAPDRSIVIQDLWPISNAMTIVNALAPYGIEQHDCNALPELLTLSADTIWCEYETTGQLLVTNNTENAVDITNIVEILENDYLEILVMDNGYGYFYGGETITLEPNEVLELNIYPSLYAGRDGNAKANREIVYIETGVDIISNLGTQRVVVMINDDIYGWFGVVAYWDTLKFENYDDVKMMGVGNANINRSATITGYEEVGSDYLIITPPSELPIVVEPWGVVYFTLALNLPIEMNEKGYTEVHLVFHSDHGDFNGYVLINDNILSISENSVEDITVYPNPANDFIRVSCENMQKILVYNLIGQKLAEQTVSGNKFVLSTENFQPGTYILQVIDNTNKIKTQRFVVGK